MFTEKQNLISKILASNNFQWRNYADTYHLHGRDSDDTIDNISLHLERQDFDFISMLFEANCDEEVNNHYQHQHFISNIIN